jgi:hypothetical protein
VAKVAIVKALSQWSLRADIDIKLAEGGFRSITS